MAWRGAAWQADPAPGEKPRGAGASSGAVDAALATVEGMLQWREKGVSVAALVAGLGKLREDLARARQAQAAAERARERLRRQLAGLRAAAEGGDADAVTFVFPAAAGLQEVRIAHCRAVVRQWSPALELLTRHGNGFGGEFPKEVRLLGVAPEVFKAAARYMACGELEKDDVAPLEDPAHPLLEFADQFDLRELVDDYFELVLGATPLGVDNAGRILDLALRHNCKTSADAAASFLARRLQTETLPFLALSAEAATAVLARDDLHVGSRGAEHDVVQLALRWVRHDAARAEQAHVLLGGVRMELLSIRELTELQGKVSSKSTFGKESRQLLRRSIKAALAQKLAAEDEERQPLRKRHRSVLADKTNEDATRKMLRATLGVLGVGLPRGARAASRRASCRDTEKENEPPPEPPQQGRGAPPPQAPCCRSQEAPPSCDARPASPAGRPA
ncbi:unnamed protein product [Prorocentrum cordatum]|uniref:BACK domain-containing protein n=1 Tax=Prorocentrum cordatum TaxID=2364126 RepID=A0ABN9SRP6_9DINO|nr:unnamed protein product [Polarella glacialis]